MKVLDRIHGKIGAMLLLAAGTAFTACDGILEEDEMDCTYTVRFKYDMNMKFADAFAHEVKSVALYAFKDGKLVYQQIDDDIPAMETNTYEMRLDGLKSGEYELITWAGLQNQESFVVPILEEGATMEELTCKMNRSHSRAEDGSAFVDEDLKPLFHGKTTHEFSKSSRQALVPLTKNTNVMRIILQQTGGEPLDVDNFDYYITDDNGWMGHDNRLLADELITYYPYYRADGSTATGNEQEVEEGAEISLAVVQLTVGRLMADKNPRLTIVNRKFGETVFSIPLVRYLLLTEAEGHDMSNQEYLDRQDEYSMTFFFDKYGEWISSSIIINSWKVVPPQDTKL